MIDYSIPCHFATPDFLGGCNIGEGFNATNGATSFCQKYVPDSVCYVNGGHGVGYPAAQCYTPSNCDPATIQNPRSALE